MDYKNHPCLVFSDREGACFPKLKLSAEVTGSYINRFCYQLLTNFWTGSIFNHNKYKNIVLLGKIRRATRGFFLSDIFQLTNVCYHQLKLATVATSSHLKSFFLPTTPLF